MSNVHVSVKGGDEVQYGQVVDGALQATWTWGGGLCELKCVELCKNTHGWISMSLSLGCTNRIWIEICFVVKFLVDMLEIIPWNRGTIFKMIS